jgi:hypothetical protein
VTASGDLARVFGGFSVSDTGTDATGYGVSVPNASAAV